MERARREVLRYLGHRNQPVGEDISRMISECMEEIRKECSPRIARRSFSLETEGDFLRVLETDVVLLGNNIRRHLADCDRVVIMAATLGAAADSLIRRYERIDLTRSLLLDACATQYIEEFCDSREDEIRREADSLGFGATSRFSPGYGDFPLDIQPQILAILNAQRAIGLACSESLILIPRKSVTALIGIGKGAINRPADCASCNLYEKCSFGKDKAANGCSFMDTK